jgi:hypothetical protein
MPSPFPGMDPYLEGDDWTSFHAHFVTEIARQLTPRLRPKYIALPEKRFDLVDEGGVAMETKIPYTWVEIRDVPGRRLVTTIEILSPWNKRGTGRAEYFEKRRKLLHGASHLIEIDLLRRVRWLPMKDRLPPGSYFVFVSRAEQRPQVQVWPIALDHPLQSIPVPLLIGDGDIALDLQSALQNVYDVGGFDLVLDYSKAPPVPLRDDQAAWAAERLRAARGR